MCYYLRAYNWPVFSRPRLAACGYPVTTTRKCGFDPTPETLG